MFPPNSVGLVKTHYLTFAEDEPFLLESGAALRPVTLAYETYGRLNAERSNAILICHALSGGAHAAGYLSPDDAARATWIDALLRLAVQRLGRRAAWTLRHPPGLADALRAVLAQHDVANATLVEDATLDAGLVIEADGARLDGTPAALLADRPAVEAELLAQLVIAEGAHG